MADDEEAVVLACTSLVFCALDLHQSQEQLLEKRGGQVDMSTSVHAVATPLNTCRASRACRACRVGRVAPCCPTSATQHVTTFSCVKMHGLDSVSCRDVTQQVEFELKQQAGGDGGKVLRFSSIQLCQIQKLEFISVLG